LPEQQQRERAQPETEHGDIGVAELPPEHPDAFEEVFATPRDAEELRHLCHGDGQRGARLEAEQDGLADEAHQGAESQQPGEHADGGEHERAQRAGLPSAMPETVTPTSMDIADVGPMASCRDVPKSAYARPPTR